MEPALCSIDDCLEPAKKRGWCTRHYTRWHRYGDPLAVRYGPDSPAQTERKCAACERVLPIVEFGKGNKRSRGGVSSYCRSCSAERQRVWRANNPERVREHSRRDREKRKPTRWMDRMRSEYGITFEQYAQLVAAQGGACAICGTTTPNGAGKRFHIDHDHECCDRVGSCGECIRGLLCGRCNTAIGLLGSDVERYERAVAYLSGPRVVFVS